VGEGLSSAGIKSSPPTFLPHLFNKPLPPKNEGTCYEANTAGKQTTSLQSIWTALVVEALKRASV